MNANYQKKILLLSPDPNDMGGVSGFFNTLKLDDTTHVQHLPITSFEKESAFDTAFRLIKNYVLFYKLIKRDNIQLVHVNPSFNRNSFLRDGMFIFLTLLLGKKVLVFFHGWDNAFEEKLKQSGFLKFAFSKTYQRCHNFIVLSQVFKQKLIGLGVNPEKTRFWIETTVADDSYLNELDLEKKIASKKKRVSILFFSRIVKNKGVYIAIDAFHKVSQKLPHYPMELIIAGDGEELPAVKDYVAQNNIPGIKFLGYVRNEQKKETLLNSHILLFPTYYGEGLPVAILEAMLYGMPVISRYNAGIGDVVEHGVNGFLTESKDPEIFEEPLMKLVTEESLYKEIALRNHAKAVSNYTAAVIREKILHIYREVLNKNQ